MEKEKTQISLTLAENESVIRTWCENCDDIQIRPMKLGKTGGTGGELRYVEGFRDREAVEPSDGGSRGRYPGGSLGKSARNFGHAGI